MWLQSAGKELFLGGTKNGLNHLPIAVHRPSAGSSALLFRDAGAMQEATEFSGLSYEIIPVPQRAGQNGGLS